MYRRQASERVASHLNFSWRRKMGIRNCAVIWLGVERESSWGIGNALRWDWSRINANARLVVDGIEPLCWMVINERVPCSPLIANWFPIEKDPTAIERIISIKCVGQRSIRWHRNCRKMFVKTNLCNCGSLSVWLCVVRMRAALCQSQHFSRNQLSPSWRLLTINSTEK